MSKLCVGGGCQAAVTVRIRCGYIEFRECGELLYGRFHIMLKWIIYKGFLRPAILYGSDVWCLKVSEMGILRRRERSMVRAMCR